MHGLCWTVSGRIKVHVVQICTNGASPNHLLAIVSSGRPWRSHMAGSHSDCSTREMNELHINKASPKKGLQITICCLENICTVVIEARNLIKTWCPLLLLVSLVVQFWRMSTFVAVSSRTTCSIWLRCRSRWHSLTSGSRTLHSNCHSDTLESSCPLNAT